VFVLTLAGALALATMAVLRAFEAADRGLGTAALRGQSGRVSATSLARPPGRGTPRSSPVDLTATLRARASATAPDHFDDAHNSTSYRASNVLDSNPSTSWRVVGNGQGATVTLILPRPRRVTQVGLIPGYAKTDPATGRNRFFQENRILEVRWLFDGGRTVSQRFRDLPVMQRTATNVVTRSVTIQIVATRPGDPHYNYTPISDVQLLGTA
jgi:hypothetical protein